MSQGVSLVELEEQNIIQLGRGKVISKKDLQNIPGDYPVYSSSIVGDGRFGTYGKHMFNEELITWSVDGGGKLFHRKKHKFSITNVTGFLRILKPEKINYKYLCYFLSLLHSKINFDWVKKAHPSVLRKEYTNILLPTLAEQQRIAAKLDSTFAEIDKAKSAMNSNTKKTKILYKSYLKEIFEHSCKDYKEYKLGDICKIIGGGTPSKTNPKFYGGDIPWATVRDMKSDIIELTDFKITKEAVKQSSTNIIPKNNVVIATRVGLGKVCILKNDTAINQDLKGIMPINPKIIDVNYLFYWFKNNAKVIEDFGTGATVQGVKLPFIKSLTLKLPKINEQKKIVDRIIAINFNINNLNTITIKKNNEFILLQQSILKKALNIESTKVS